jgi:hypothetical protein
MSEILALQINLCPAQMLCEAFCKIERCWPADICLLEMSELELEILIPERMKKCFLKLLEGRHEGFRDKTSAIYAEISSPVRQFFDKNVLLKGYRLSLNSYYSPYQQNSYIMSFHNTSEVVTGSLTSFEHAFILILCTELLLLMDRVEASEA